MVASYFYNPNHGQPTTLLRAHGHYSAVRFFWANGAPQSPPPPPPTATISPAVVQRDGGYEITVTLSGSVVDGLYFIHVGPNGDTTDDRCYSGIPGQGEQIQVTSFVFTCWVPPMPVGGPYAFTFVPVAGGSTITSVAALPVVPQFFRNRIQSLRKIFPPFWKTGFRSLDQVEFPQE